MAAQPFILVVVTNRGEAEREEISNLSEMDAAWKRARDREDAITVTLLRPERVGGWELARAVTNS